MDDIEGNFHRSRHHFVNALPVGGLFLHAFVQLAADVGLQQQPMKLGETAFCEK